MSVDSRQLAYFKKIAELHYVTTVLNDYGSDKQPLLLHLTDTISDIYKYLRYNRFVSVIIYIAFDEHLSLSSLKDANPKTINSYENLTPILGETITIEVKANGTLNYSLDFDFDVDTVRSNAIVYKFIKSTEVEIVFGKQNEIKLLSIPDADSYFAIQTYKDLELALEDYSTKVARHSECPFLQQVWFDNSNKIFFRPKPEHTLRDSLRDFLNKRLRNAEARPEQIVDKTHPVDLKVTWSLANHLALIEIKWLGKSLEKIGKRFKQIYTRQRALDGADQLVDYLKANIKLAPVKTTKGYLVVFDARRWGCNSKSTSINKANGLRYVNDEIIYNPEYHKDRDDFAKPIRFFLEPITID